MSHFKSVLLSHEKCGIPDFDKDRVCVTVRRHLGWLFKCQLESKEMLCAVQRCPSEFYIVCRLRLHTIDSQLKAHSLLSIYLPFISELSDVLNCKEWI